MSYRNDRREKNKLWITKGNDSNIITHGEIVITDTDKYNQAFEELRDISTYILTGVDLHPGSSSNYTKYIADGAIEYKNFGETEEYIRSHFQRKYTNPRKEAFKLLTGEFDDSKDLLDLFKTLQTGDTQETRADEFDQAKRIIQQLETSALDKTTIEAIISKMWPGFGYYATKCLNCTDIEYIQEYNLDELLDVVQSCKKAGVQVSDEVTIALRNQGLAENNGKVLTLARKANRISNPTR